MSRDQKEKAASDSIVHPIDYSPATGPSVRRIPLAARLIAESVCSVGAVLSFEAAYCFHLELSTRRAIPTTQMPLYWHGIGLVAFVVGLVLTLLKGHQRGFWNVLILLCLTVGAVAMLLGISSGVAWE